MKLALNLTFEDGAKVIEAIKDVAIENGWDAEELDECGVIEEYSRVVDAALTAMGISVNIAGEPEDDDEAEDEDDDENEEVDDFGVPTDYWSEFDEDEDEDKDEDENEDEDEEDTCKYSLTPKGEFILSALEAGISFESACELANLLSRNNHKGE